MELKDRIAVVTGGAAGIGKSIAVQFARAGAKVAVCDVKFDEAKETAQTIGGTAYKVDVANFAEVAAVGEEIAKTLGTIHILVNNAGVTRDTLFLRMDEKDWDFVLGINLKGAFNFTKAAIRYMMKERWGRIINISSVIGLIGNAGQVNYAASKAGILGLTKSLAREFASRNITVNAIAPGYIETALTQNLPANLKEAYLKTIPLGRLGIPEDVANTCMFLASDRASYITGQVIHVDGGMVM
jgi:3-oxoacyl-[acyl-carrier protein] reductase